MAIRLIRPDIKPRIRFYHGEWVLYRSYTIGRGTYDEFGRGETIEDAYCNWLRSISWGM